MPGVKTLTVVTGNNLFLNLNTQQEKSPFRDVRVRQAAAHAIDVDAIIKSVLFGQGERYVQVGKGGVGYDPVKGFSPITYLFNSVVVLTVPTDLPSKTMAELHELGRKRPGGLNFGTPGLGSPSHLLGAKILLAAKVPAEIVHYRGGAPMMADLVTGRVDFSWPTLSTSRTFISGSTPSPARSSRFPSRCRAAMRRATSPASPSS